MKLALVYDRVNKFGGAERVLRALHQLWPQAPLYTAVYNPQTASWAKDIKVVPSFLQHFPLAKTHHELYPWLTTPAFESFNFSQFDVVISVTSAEAKAVITPPQTLHLCYCLTPTRYLWSHQQQYLDTPGLGLFSQLGRGVFKLLTPYLTSLDFLTSHRPDHYLAISQTVQKRIKKYYQQDSTVIHPPVNTQDFSFKPSQDYFLLVSRLIPYKQIDLAIKAFNRLQLPLYIVGTGRDQFRLKRLAGPTIKFFGQTTDQKLIKLYQRCQALIMPQEEDFGIVSLEAQASGKPVIALNKGGVLDTVIPNQTAVLFNQPTVDSLIAAVKQFKTCSWDKDLIQSQAKKFDVKIFKQKISSYVEAQWQKHQKNFQ